MDRKSSKFITNRDARFDGNSIIKEKALVDDRVSDQSALKQVELVMYLLIRGRRIVMMHYRQLYNITKDRRGG